MVVDAGVKTGTAGRLYADGISHRPKICGRKNTNKESMGQGMIPLTCNVIALLLSAGPLVWEWRQRNPCRQPEAEVPQQPEPV